MKKELMKAVESGGYFKINEAITLDREIGINFVGEKVDCLTARIKVIGIKGWYEERIESRDYDGIIKELNVIIQKAYTQASESLCKAINAGYC